MSTCGSPLPLFQRIALSRGCILAARQGGGQPSTPRQDTISAPDSRHTGHGERLAVARGGARRQNGPKARTIRNERRVGVRTGQSCSVRKEGKISQTSRRVRHVAAYPCQTYFIVAKA
ncbi:unnamed protein product [Gadus morhua 'NCC']